MEEAHARRRRRVLAKLGEVCRRIESLLAGQEVTVADLKLPQERAPGETDLDRLRRFMRLLEETLAELSRGETRRCAVCEEPLDGAGLDEVPWASTCRRCAST